MGWMCSEGLSLSVLFPDTLVLGRFGFRRSQFEDELGLLEASTWASRRKMSLSPGSFLVFHSIILHLPHLVRSSHTWAQELTLPLKLWAGLGGGPPATKQFLQALHIAGFGRGGRRGTSSEIKSDY
uniref:Uncharacterized protein n=1 Tax=Myotis myotis TaxID=51298 RepID=A0A7J8AML5_MYOMY|nr:hypothetical protein mMyoMyo1_007985 [Myotis myotis]